MLKKQMLAMQRERDAERSLIAQGAAKPPQAAHTWPTLFIVFSGDRSLSGPGPLSFGLAKSLFGFFHDMALVELSCH